MRIKAIMLLAALSLVCLGVQAHATQYPPGPDGPGGACDDTLDVSNLNNGPCRPGSACAFPSTVGCDSAYGVKGIITGIKNNGTSRTFYVQSRRTNLQYTGLDVFNGTAGLTNANIQIGDSVSVSGKVEEAFANTMIAESGETELSGFDASNSTADVVVNILSSGNSLPEVKQLTVADIRFSYLGLNAAEIQVAEPWENCLVKVIGPLIIGRRVYNGAVNSPTVGCTTCGSFTGIETRSPGGGGFLAYPEGAPGDSIYIDMTSFVTMTPDPVGTKVDSVYGILQGGATRSGYGNLANWRIAVRSSPPTYANSSSADIYVSSPPNVAAAFPVADDSVRIDFDRAVTQASATIPSHYNLTTSERTVDFVRMVGNTGVVCHIDPASGSWPVGDLDEVSSVGMTGLVSLKTQISPQLSTFVNGVLPIPMIQAPNADSLSVCIDRSSYSGPGFTNGPRLTFDGTCTARFGSQYYVQEEAGGPRSGVLVFQPGSVMTVGRKYLISGHVTEFFSETEVNQPPVVIDRGVGTVPPLFVSTIQILDNFACDAGQSQTNGEDYEGCLVDFSHFLRASADAGIAGVGGFFHATNHATPLDTADVQIDLAGVAAYDPEPDDLLDVKGVLGYRFSQGVVLPRNAADITKLGVAGVDPVEAGRVSFSLHPNPGRVAQLHFTLPARADVELSVFDLSGRRLATMARGSFPAGTYSRQWNGVTDRGTKTGSGVFFYRLKVGDETFNVRGVRVD